MVQLALGFLNGSADIYDINEIFFVLILKQKKKKNAINFLSIDLVVYLMLSIS